LTITDTLVSFVDQDMVMCYFCGGIGHLKNTPPQQVPGPNLIDPSSEEMAVEEDSPCSGNVTNECVVMNSGELVQMEVGEDNDDDGDSDDDEDSDGNDDEDDEEDEDNSDGNEGRDETDEDEDGEDDYGYACP
jgi:hypothetical protein